jgi:hypothetical protein
MIPSSSKEILRQTSVDTLPDLFLDFGLALSSRFPFANIEASTAKAAKHVDAMKAILMAS